MEEVTRSFVQKIYEGFVLSSSISEEVSIKDPMKIKIDKMMQGFRFYDRDCLIYEGKEYYGDKKNYSDWIFIGKRLSLEEFIDKYGNNESWKTLIEIMKINGFKYVCDTSVGIFLPMGDNDITYDEYIQKINRENPEKIK